MSVTRVAPRWEGRGATTDEKGVRTLKRQWTVETDSDATGEPAVIDAVIAVDPSAALYASHPNWAWAVCRELTAEPNGGPRVWTVNASYSTAPFEAKGDGSGSGNNSESPNQNQSNQTQADQRPPTIAITRKEVTKVLEYDAVLTEGVPAKPKRILNKLGDPFDPLPEVFRSHQVITWKFHRTPVQLNWGTRATFHDKLNQDDVVILGRTYPALTLRCIDYSLDTVWETGATGLALFFALTVQAEYDPDGWQLQILNTGKRKRVGGSIGDPTNPARLVAIVDGNGQPITEPVPLTAEGVPLEPGGVPDYVSASGYVPVNWKGAGGSLTGAGGILA